MSERPDYEIAREGLAALMEREGLTISAAFVPFSQSRNAAPREPGGKPWESLNWRVTLQRKGRDVLATDYSAGTGHCPASKMTREALESAASVIFRTTTARAKAALIAHEIETGRTGRPSHGWGIKSGAPILPDSVDVFASLASEADALEYGGFEGWADAFGYDTDSRKAEAAYRSCLDTALKLRAALGDSVLTEARELAGRL